MLLLTQIIRCLSLASLLAFAPLGMSAEQFEPKVGQAGKDVIWVPTPDALVARMLEIAKVTPNDYLVDLGSGDGRTVIAAAKRGVNALGVEFDPNMVSLSRRNAEAFGVTDKAQFIQGDIFATDFRKATVVTMYLLSSLNLKLRPTLLAMRPGTRIVSHAFTMGDWSADETVNVEGYSAYLWIVPAKIDGRWRVTSPNPFEITIEQTFQKFVGTVAGKGWAPNVGDPQLQASAVNFTLADSGGAFVRFRGTVKDDAMEGTFQASSGSEGNWSAKRVR